MDPRRYIARMCSQYGVSLDFGRRLQPLVERAVAAEPGKRRLLLQLVERSFAEEARRAARERATAAEELRALSSVAAVLHGWRPPGWFERWDDEPPRPESDEPA